MHIASLLPKQEPQSGCNLFKLIADRERLADPLRLRAALAGAEHDEQAARRAFNRIGDTINAVARITLASATAPDRVKRILADMKEELEEAHAEAAAFWADKSEALDRAKAEAASLGMEYGQ